MNLAVCFQQNFTRVSYFRFRTADSFINSIFLYITNTLLNMDLIHTKLRQTDPQKTLLIDSIIPPT